MTRLEAETRFETPRWFGIDEIHVIRRPRCVLTNVETRTIIDLLPDRSKASVAQRVFTLHNKVTIRYVAMDMWAPYRDTVRAVLPNATIVWTSSTSSKWRTTASNSSASLCTRAPGTVNSGYAIDRTDYMAKDPARAIAFYRDVLGLELQSLAPDESGGEFELSDGSTFGLWVGSDDVMPFQPSNGVLFAVDDLDAAVSALEARGVPVIARFETPVFFMALINDTEGNVVTLHKRKAAASPS